MRQEAEPGDPDDTAARVWRTIRTLVLSEYDSRRAASEAVGLGFVRIKALRVLAGSEEPMRHSKLAERLGVDRPYVTVVVDDLERRGLVTRTPDARDRRCKLVTVTETGRQAVAVADEVQGRPPAPLRGLPVSDLAELERILAPLVQH